jgi:TfoX/Sxy family transcriptional regulator of competence genes
MAFDEGLAERVRHLGVEPGLSERKMFGGLCFLLNGNMSYGIVGNELMVRVSPAAYLEALALPHAREWTSPDALCAAWSSYLRMASLKTMI